MFLDENYLALFIPKLMKAGEKNIPSHNRSTLMSDSFFTKKEERINPIQEFFPKQHFFDAIDNSKSLFFFLNPTIQAKPESAKDNNIISGIRTKARNNIDQEVGNQLLKSSKETRLKTQRSRRGRPTGVQLDERAASNIRDQINRGGITVTLYVNQQRGVKGRGEFRRQATQYAQDHNAIGINARGQIRTRVAMEMNASISTVLLSITDGIQRLSNTQPDLSTALEYRTVDIQNLAIFTHGLRHDQQAGPRARGVRQASDITPCRTRQNWIELGDWDKELVPFLTAIPFAEALRMALRTELSSLYAPGTRVEPEVGGHTTAAHTTANRFLSRTGGGIFRTHTDLIPNFQARFLAMAYLGTRDRSTLTARQRRGIRRYAYSQMSAALIAPSNSRTSPTNTFIREIPHVGMNNVWTLLTTTSAPSWSPLHLSEAAEDRMTRGLAYFRRQFRRAQRRTKVRINRAFRGRRRSRR